MIVDTEDMDARDEMRGRMIGRTMRGFVVLGIVDEGRPS